MRKVLGFILAAAVLDLLVGCAAGDFTARYEDRLASAVAENVRVDLYDTPCKVFPGELERMIGEGTAKRALYTSYLSLTKAENMDGCYLLHGDHYDLLFSGSPDEPSLALSIPVTAFMPPYRADQAIKDHLRQY